MRRSLPVLLTISACSAPLTSTVEGLAPEPLTFLGATTEYPVGGGQGLTLVAAEDADACATMQAYQEAIVGLDPTDPDDQALIWDAGRSATPVGTWRLGVTTSKVTAGAPEVRSGVATRANEAPPETRPAEPFSLPPWTTSWVASSVEGTIDGPDEGPWTVDVTLGNWQRLEGEGRESVEGEITVRATFEPCDGFSFGGL